MYPNSTVKIDRLSKLLKYHFDELSWLRISNSALVKRYAGTHYGKSGDKQRRQDCVSLMWQTCEAYCLALVANAPRYMATSEVPGQSGFARHFARAVNALVREIRLEATLESTVRDGFFSQGVVKVHLADSAAVQVENDVWMDPGQPFAQRISNDNICFDTKASDWRGKKFCADRYRIDFEKLKDSSVFDQSVVKNLKPNSKYAGDHDLARSLSNGDDEDYDEYKPMIDVADVYLPDERLICTYAVNRDFEVLGNKAVAERDVGQGPEEGPYRQLSLGPVPDNIVPTSPAANLKFLHDLGNSVFRKSDRQAKRQKSVTMYRGGAEDDMKRVNEANDGESIRVDDPDAIKTATWGGVDAGNLAFLGQVITLFDRMGGNVQAKLGLGAQSPTAAQDQMQMEQVSRSEEAMQNRVMRFVSEIGSDLGNLLFSDPIKHYPGQVDLGIEGYEPLDDSWTPGLRQGSFQDYRLWVEPYSMAFKSPTQRLGAINQVVAQFLQNPQVLAEQGVQFDIKELISITAELLNEPRLLNVFRFDRAIREMEEQQGPPAGGTSTRNYVRRNVSGGPSDNAKNHVNMQQLLAGGGRPAVNQQQQAMMMQ